MVRCFAIAASLLLFAYGGKAAAPASPSTPEPATTPPTPTPAAAGWHCFADEDAGEYMSSCFRSAAECEEDAAAAQRLVAACAPQDRAFCYEDATAGTICMQTMDECRLESDACVER